FRMARAGLLHVPGDECRPPGTGRALRIDQQPQFRRSAGAGRSHPSGVAGDGRRSRCCRTFRRREDLLMRAFTVVTSKVAPLDRPNVDTDAIIPKQYLKSIRRTGFGPFLFDDWRYL